MSHVAPHRWADAAAGKLDAAELSRMAAHADGCARCARARDRVTAARTAFADVARATPPELRWEHLGARIYWASSQERRTGSLTTLPAAVPWWRRRVAIGAAIALPSLALAALGVVWLASDDAAAPAPAVADVAPAPRLPDEITPVTLYQPDRDGAPVPAPMLGLVTLAQGDATRVGADGGAAALLATPITAGTALATGDDGRLSVQLEAGTAFALGAASRLDIARLDRAAIELHVDGDVTVEVARRAPGQRFVVIAGGRAVEVRGTAFSVSHRDGELAVACSHGLVAVADRAAPGEVVEVGAGRRWSAADGVSILDAVPTPLDADGLTRLIAAQPAQLPAWPGSIDASAPIAIAAAPGRSVKVDGVVMGQGTLHVRVMSGRHLVEVERAPGRYATGQWVATRDDGRPAKVNVPAEPAVADKAERVAGVGARRKQLEGAVDHRAMSGCLRSLAKQGLAAGTHVEVKIGVDETGAVTFLNLGDTDLPATTAGCVRDVVARVRFEAGPAASWRHRFSF